MSSFCGELDDLETAEDFLRFFGIEFDARVVHVNRLHILQRFHDYLTEETNLDTLSDELLRDRYKALISLAYDDFVKSDAIAVSRMPSPRAVAARSPGAWWGWSGTGTATRLAIRLARGASRPAASLFASMPSTTTSR